MKSKNPAPSIPLSNGILMPEIIRLLEEGYTVTLPAKGNSMLPFVHGDRDSVVLQKSTSYRPGDIVLASLTDNSHVVHRIYQLKGESVQLMGDGNCRKREDCRLKDIAGKAVRILRNGREVECDSKAEQRKGRWWRRLLPVRKYLLFIYRLLTSRTTNLPQERRERCA